MPIDKPFPKIYRRGSNLTLGSFQEDSRSPAGINNFASYEIIKRDFLKILEYVEPQQCNFNVYSHRIYELLLRTCTEVESLFRQIFESNKNSLNNLNIIRFSDLESAMKLSEYVVKSYNFPFPEFSPFSSFSEDIKRDQRSPSWFKAYNDVKHNRYKFFNQANLKNLIEAIGGVFVLLVST